MASITYSSPYLAHLNAPSADNSRLTALITAADKAVARYTRRHLEQAEYDEVFLMKGQSTIFLSSYPVSVINRIMIQKTTCINLATTATIGSYGTSPTGITLTKIEAGVRTDTTLLYATYPGLIALVAAINGVSGFSATVVPGFGAYPSGDIVAGLTGSANQNSILIWYGNTTAYQADYVRGFIHITGNNLWLATGVTPSQGDFGDAYAGIPNDGYISDVYRGVRVVWTGGYSPVPEDLQQVIGQIVSNMYIDTYGRMTAEALGGYSYSLSDANLNRLPITSRKTLDTYRVRLV